MTIYYFYTAVILSQILVVSLYAPSIVAHRVRALLATRPPAEYPKLYPVPVATIERTLRLYRILNAGIAVLGLALLAAAWAFGYFGSDRDSATPYAIYTMLQVVPVLLWGRWEKRYFQRMSAGTRNSIRRAELKPRRLFDFVSPTQLGLVVTTYVGAAVSLVFMTAAPIPEPRLTSAFMFTVITIANLFFASGLVWVRTPKRSDPHQSHGDRARAIRAVYQAAVATIILINAYVALQSVLTSFDVMQYAGFAASLLTQFFVLAAAKASVLVLNQEDFEVYKADATRA
jgi:hypothetical protein